MNALMNDSGAFELEYCIWFVDARIKDIVDNTISFEYLPSSTSATCLRNILFARILLKSDHLLPLLKKLSVNVFKGRNPVVFHVDSSVIYGFDSDEVELIVEGAEYFIENQTGNITFCNISMYNTAWTSPSGGKCIPNTLQALKVLSRCAMAIQSNSSLSVKQLILKNMQLFY